MENKLLTLLENDATLTPEQLSKMLEKEVGRFGCCFNFLNRNRCV